MAESTDSCPPGLLRFMKVLLKTKITTAEKFMKRYPDDMIWQEQLQAYTELLEVLDNHELACIEYFERWQDGRKH